MPSIFDNTQLFAEHANQRFKETFEHDGPPLPSTSSKKHPDVQQLKMKQLEAENQTLRENLESVESRLSTVLAENSKLKELIEESNELAKLSPVKQGSSSSKPSKPIKEDSSAKKTNPIKQGSSFSRPLKPIKEEPSVKKTNSVNNRDTLLKPYIDEIKHLKLKLAQYESNENLDETRIVRFLKSNPLDEAVRRYGSVKKN